MMLLGQVPTSTSSEMGVWIVALAAFLVIIGTALGIAVAIKTLRSPTPLAQSYVTHDEFDRFRIEIKADIASMKTEMAHAMKATKEDLVDRVKELETYTRGAHHELLTHHGTLLMHMGVIEGHLGIKGSVVRPVPPQV